LSMLAEALIPRLPNLDMGAKSAVISEAEHRPWRWRASARRNLESPFAAVRLEAAGLLSRIGDATDVARLSRLASSGSDLRGSRLAQDLSRRLAPAVLVEDLGRVRILVGDRVIDGAQVRRKVLALLCVLLTRPRFSMTRDEAIDSLWPDVDPSAALNSLNQTVYFLRRVFEPTYRDELSPGYVGQDGETVWLDPELIDSRSRRCHSLVASMPSQPSPEMAVALAKQYEGRFALDFAYEEWAESFRDGLHAAYLRVMEHAIRLDLDTGHWARGTFLAERAAEIEPDSEAIQLALIRLYRHSGAHAAAAERYGRYVHVLNDLGIEAPALADI
jgi:DNA-binding SARP family transcriptional activator